MDNKVIPMEYIITAVLKAKNIEGLDPYATYAECDYVRRMLALGFQEKDYYFGPVQDFSYFRKLDNVFAFDYGKEPPMFLLPNDVVSVFLDSKLILGLLVSYQEEKLATMKDYLLEKDTFTHK